MAEDAILRVRMAVMDLRACGAAMPEPPPSVGDAAEIVRQVPPWVARISCASEGTDIWMLCETDAAASGSLGQAVIDVPPGRYLIDTFDCGARVCIARESAAAAPLVIGLARADTAVLLWIRSLPSI